MSMQSAIVWHLSLDAMVLISHKKHFVQEMHQVWVSLQHLLKSLIPNDLVFIPCSNV